MKSKENVPSIFLALGSNLGDKQHNIEKAYLEIEKRIGKIISFSAFYLSKPVGFESDHDFVNSVCEVATNINVYSVFASIQSIEYEMGRGSKTNSGAYTDRIIDIDLLLAGNTVINTSDLTIPHPRMHLRDFVIFPLCEIAPDRIHPVLEKTIKELKEEFDFDKKQDDSMELQFLKAMKR